MEKHIQRIYGTPIFHTPLVIMTGIQEPFQFSITTIPATGIRGTGKVLTPAASMMAPSQFPGHGCGKLCIKITWQDYIKKVY